MTYNCEDLHLLTRICTSKYLVGTIIECNIAISDYLPKAYSIRLSTISLPKAYSIRLSTISIIS